MDIIASFILFMSNLHQNEPISQSYSLDFGYKFIFKSLYIQIKNHTSP